MWIELPVAFNDKVGFTVSWAGTQQETAGSLYLNVAAGDHWRNTLGAYNLLLTESTEVTGGSTRCQIKRWFIGPFESAQFVKAAASSAAGATVGDPVIRFGLSTALATAALTTRERHKVHIQAFKMPTVDYDT